MNDLTRYFSFDLIGDFAVSRDFGMIDKREYTSTIKMLRSAMKLLGPFGHAICMPRLGFTFTPGLGKIKS